MENGKMLFLLILMIYLPQTYGWAREGSVRLVGGHSRLEGRVEIYHNGQWGTVCDDHWTQTEARVICRMVGYSSYKGIAKSAAFFGEGSGPIWLDDVNCYGYETSLSRCRNIGWGKHNCHHREDAGVVCIERECARRPCQNYGTCNENSDSFTCSCRSGFAGRLCQTDINECASRPCQNQGVCQDHVNGFTCACTNGYTGKLCQTDIDDCSGNLCKNNASCIDGINQFQCACLPGFTGNLCERDIDECSSNPCHNNGSCIDGINQFQCVCLPGFTGNLCERDIDDCSGHPCHNNGSCIDGINKFQCVCLPGFTGTLCDLDIDDCSIHPCHNNASCIDGINQFQCSCLPGFTGTLCETEFSLNTEKSPADLDNSINILDKILDVSQASNLSLPKTVVVTTIDNFLAENHTNVWKDTSKSKTNGRVSKILKTVDKFGMHILENVKENESITFNTTKNMILTVAKIPADDDVVFPNKDNTSSSLVWPAQLHSSSQSIPYLAVKYKTIGNIMNGNKRKNNTSKYEVVSDILALTLKADLRKEILNPPLQLKMFKKNLSNSISECAFWDFESNNGDGGWSTKGCKTQSTNDLYIQCDCDHLTNFAVLVRPYVKLHEDEEALNWISVIGCSISVFFSCLTAIVYLVLWKSITSDISRMIDKITVLLCLSIAASYAAFLGGIDKTQFKVGCIVIAAVLQCLFLSISFLMLALGMYYFVSVSLVKISFSKATKLKSDANTFSKIIWAIVFVMPVLITAVTFGIIYSSGKDYNTNNSCWLSFESGALYGFIGPVALIILLFL
ncbi:adhesion G protein-coupled receptor E2-like [Saccostrea echinata]|uniref:adhesion G protein-coupled receptor E2-like n=1 Tax=Saccostrea echinata TaxID=191078 RepID=UPI002A7F1B7E|nr:adhesion G protein-coupled receptor E2-like [Saccostrea echinata]